MRVNVYSEEISREDGRTCQIVEKEASTGQLFFGVRIWLKSPAAILEHNTPEDDDSSAVTFWFADLDDVTAFVGKLARASHNWAKDGSRAEAA